MQVTLTPIGVARTPFLDRVSAPRQPYAAKDVPGTIELFEGRGFEHALSDLEGWEYIWVIFLFHLNDGWRPKVLPPRSEKRRGVFATRSPHRPNPIGLSAVRLVRVEGTTLHVLGVDIVDGSPVLDIKPYVPMADAFPAARTGWLAPLVAPEGERPSDPEPGFEVTFDPRAAEQAAWLAGEGIAVTSAVTPLLALGPQPHPYRRIKRDGDAHVLAWKAWRVRFRVEGRRVTVLSIASGYREGQLAQPADDLAGKWSRDEGTLALHRAFVATFGL